MVKNNIAMGNYSPKDIKRLRKELFVAIDDLLYRKHITKHVYNQLNKFVTGEKRKIKNLHAGDLLKIAHHVKSDDVKIRNFKSFYTYMPAMVYLQIQVFRPEYDIQRIRMEERGHTKNKSVMLPPSDYMIVNVNGEKVYYVGDQNFLGQSQQWRNILMKKSDFDELRTKTCFVSRGNNEIMRSYFAKNYKFINAIQNDEIKTEFEYLDDYDCLVVLHGSKNAVKLNGGYKDAEYITVMKAINEKRMLNKFLHYEINDLATSLDGLFDPSKYHRSNSCFANAMMNVWAEKYNKSYKKKKMSYELIWNICKEEEYIEGQEMPMNFKEACKMFKFVRQECFMYNDSDRPKLLAHYHPSHDGLKIDTKLGGHGCPLIVIYKDGHVFPVLDSNMKRSITLTEFKELELTPPSDTFKQINMNKKAMGCVRDVNDAINKAIPIIKERTYEVEDITLEFILNNPSHNLKDMYIQLLKSNYYPRVKFNKYLQIDRLSIKINNCIISIVPINISSDSMATDDLIEMTDEQATRYQTQAQVMNNALTNPKYRSEYGDNFKDVLRFFKRCPETLVFDDTRDELVGIDGIKFYPAIVSKEIKKVPVFGRFDMFHPYKNEEIDSYNLYIVYKLPSYPTEDKYKVLLNQQYDVMYGFALRFIREHVKILAVCVPHKLVQNDMPKDFEKLFNDDVLTEKQIKNIAVSSIGKWGILSNSASRARVYHDIKDAELDGAKELIPLDLEDKKLFVVQETVKTDLVNGFLPLQSLVYDMCRVKVFGKMLQLSDAVRVVAIKTDCIIIPKEHTKYINEKHKDALPKDYTRSFSNIGSWKLENITCVPNKADQSNINVKMEQFSRSLMYDWIVNYPKPHTYTLDDEYNNKLPIEFIESQGRKHRLLILGEHAGSGKSTMCENVIKHFANKTHFVACPQNTQALKWKKMKFEAGTLYDLCGKVLNDNKEVTSVAQREADIILCEEIGQYDTFQFSMLTKYMKDHKTSWYLANGDETQNEPIEDLNPSIDTYKYYKMIMAYLFPFQIVLEEPKRYKKDDGTIDEELKRDAMQIKYDLFKHNMNPNEVLIKYAKPIKLNEIPINAKCISYLQDTRRDVNNYMHFKQHKDPYFAGLRVKANTRTHHKDKEGQFTIHINFEYIIQSYNTKETILYNELSQQYQTIPSHLLSNFSYCHCFTGHSFQGETVDEPIVIFDRKYPRITRNWMYPALTRNRKLEIYYCDEMAPRTGFNINDVLRKIEGYKKQDAMKGRSYKEDDYITFKDVCNLSKKQKHLCNMCKQRMNFLNKHGDGLNYVVDRLNNDEAHTRNNVQLLCFHCNCSKR